MLATENGVVVFFRAGVEGEMSMGVRLSGESGHMIFAYPTGWELYQDVETSKAAGGGTARLRVPWPAPQFLPPYGATYGLADCIDCLEGRLDEPKNSGRRVGVAIETEIALKLSSSRGGERVALPLTDRSLRLQYDWFR